MAFDPDKYLAEKQGGATPAPGGFDPDAYLAEKTGAEPQVTPGRLREDASFAGSEGAGKAASGLFPRTAQAAAEGQGYGRQVLGAGLDLLSLPGRAMASLGKDKGESALNSMADTQGSSFVGKVLRDPGTGAALLTAPLAGAVGAATAGAAGVGRLGAFGARLAGGAAAGATEGAASAASHQAERARTDQGIDLGEAALEIGVNAALPVFAGGLGAGAKKVVEKAGSVLKGHGEKIATTAIKPSLRDIKDGFNVQNVYKHGIQGSLEEMAEKLDTRFTQLNDQLTKAIGQSTEKVDLIDSFSKAIGKLSDNPAETFGKNTQMDKAEEFILAEIDKIAPDGVVDLPTAQILKRRLGKMGAWAYGVTDPDALAREELANKFFGVLKKEIEDKSPEGVKEINKALHELIPIERAVTRRLPIEQRNAVLSLSDYVTLGGGLTGGMLAGSENPTLAGAGGALLGLAGKRALNSPTVAAKAYGAGSRMATMQLPEFAGGKAASRRALSTGWFGLEEPEEE